MEPLLLDMGKLLQGGVIVARSLSDQADSCSRDSSPLLQGRQHSPKYRSLQLLMMVYLYIYVCRVRAYMPN